MYVIHLFAQQLPILEAWLGYVTVCRILMAWKMRGIKAGYKVMQPLMAREAINRVPTNRSDLITVSSR
jgi:hypothetical protein